MNIATEDMVGQTFHRLTVLEVFRKPGEKHAFLKCKCTCGKITRPRAFQVKSGRTRSCGCLAKEMRKDVKIKTFMRTGGARHMA